MARGEWEHAICERCWRKKFASQLERDLGLSPIRAVFKRDEVCCFCNHETRSGIYLREDPKSAKCRGVHPVIAINQVV